MMEKILRCDCTNEKTLVECEMRYQGSYELKQVCRVCYPELYEKSPPLAAPSRIKEEK